MSDWVLAIDFGTSSTAAVIADASGAEVVEIGGAARIPSMVAALDDDVLVAGDAAQRQLTVAPERVERAPKRRLGDRAVLLGDRAVSPTALAATVLRLVADEARRRRGGSEPTTVRLTHPASWASTRLDALRAAAASAGLPEPELLAEPVAAALHLSDSRIAVGDHVAVYDLGGGTFDAAVLRRTQDGFVLVGPPGGNDRVGGEDLDEKLLEHVGESIRAQDAEAWERLRFSEERVWRRAAAVLRNEVRAAKESLSSAAAATIYVQAPVDLEVRITREELEKIVRPDLDRTAEELLATVSRAGLTVGDLSAVYLVGGASRMPLVGRVVAERTGITPTTWGDPKAAVALGAAAAPAHAVPDEAPVAPPVASPVAAPASPVASPAPSRVSQPVAGDRPVGTSHRRRNLVGVAAAAVVAVAVGTAAALAGGGGGGGKPHSSPTVPVVALPAYSFAKAADASISSEHTWTLDATGTALLSTTQITNLSAQPLHRTAVVVVPKEVASTVGGIAFDGGYAVVQADPVVRYAVALAAHARRTLTYRVTLQKPATAADLNAFGAAQRRAERAFLPRLRSLVPAAVLGAAPAVPFSEGVDPGPTSKPSPTPSRTPEPTQTRSPASQPTQTVVPVATHTSASPAAVNHAPVLAALGSVTADEKSLPGVTARGSDSDHDALSYSASGLPSGLSISRTTGRLSGSISYTAASGTPHSSSSFSIASKSFTVRITVKDPKGLSASRTFTMTVRDTYGVMPEFYNDYGDGSLGKPNISSISSAVNDCSTTTSGTADGQRIWHQSVGAGTVIKYGQSVHYYYGNDTNNCPNHLPSN